VERTRAIHAMAAADDTEFQVALAGSATTTGKDVWCAVGIEEALKKSIKIAMCKPV